MATSYQQQIVGKLHCTVIKAHLWINKCAIPILFSLISIWLLALFVKVNLLPSSDEIGSNNADLIVFTPVSLPQDSEPWLDLGRGESSEAVVNQLAEMLKGAGSGFDVVFGEGGEIKLLPQHLPLKRSDQISAAAQGLRQNLSRLYGVSQRRDQLMAVEDADSSRQFLVNYMRDANLELLWRLEAAKMSHDLHPSDHLPDSDRLAINTLRHSDHWREIKLAREVLGACKLGRSMINRVSLDEPSQTPVIPTDFIASAQPASLQVVGLSIGH
ncbi:hypothetical protein DU002_11815 [Corallincola holothuriorum]|uniref:Uncharacterized protein n=1 Tax=Corallincola holothuriorum TaxID=2282215 RepID=A0A368NIL5_9GAMM|nr:hypothetical protein [Corallincola holothuriorum]RCU49595.1 hypothetical protein DU002_11815 [Corallincola holothuriorum]